MSGILSHMKVVAQNRRARFDYEIIETIDAGIILTGAEVKSCRLGQVSLAGSYVLFLQNTPILRNAKISPYAYAGPQPGYDPGRERPLLLKKTECEKLQAYEEQKGLTLIPLEMKAGRFIKLTLAVARGRKRIDKRERIKEREMGRRMRRGRGG